MQLGRLPLHWAARNKHYEVYRFLKSITNDPSQLDLYGISADSFLSHLQPDSISSESCIPATVLTPIPDIRSSSHSISSLNLHTISLSSSQSSFPDQIPNPSLLSPRVLDVHLEAQPSPISSSYHYPSNLESSLSKKSPFLVERTPDNGFDDTVLEWEPHDERGQNMVIGTAMPQNELPESVNPYYQLSEIEDSLHPITIPENRIHRNSLLLSPPSFIDSTKPKSKGFYALRRKLSVLLFNTHDREEEQSHSDWKPKNFLKSISFTSHSKIEENSNQTPRNSSRVSESSEDNSYVEELKSHESNETRIEDIDTPQSTQTTSSTQSEENKKSTKKNWMKFTLFEKKMKSIHKTARVSNVVETVAPFVNDNQFEECHDREI